MNGLKLEEITLEKFREISDDIDLHLKNGFIYGAADDGVFVLAFSAKDGVIKYYEVRKC